MAATDKMTPGTIANVVSRGAAPGPMLRCQQGLNERTYLLALGPKGTPVEMRGLTGPSLDALDNDTRGARLVRRTGPTSYVVVW